MERRLIHRLLLAAIFALVVTTAVKAAERPRLLVLTDIGGDPDDQQSLIRLLLYSNEFEMEGFVASASGTPGELKEKATRPDLIRELVEAYAEVRPSLTNHAAGYPLPDHLLARIKSGNPQRGREAIGDGHETGGSRFIVEVGDRPDSRPLNIAIWGGQTDFAQACWQVRNARGPTGLMKFLDHVRVYDIDDQDHIAGWMFSEFKPPFYVLAQAFAGHDKREGAYRGLYLGGDESLVSRDWMETNIRQKHGALGALYPRRTWTAPNPHSAIKEGDTASWFFFLPRGFTDPTFPNRGGWGGRFNQATNGVWRDAQDTVAGVTDARSTVSRWRPAFQNEVAARMDWCVKPVGEANHTPVGVVNGDPAPEILRIPARSGQMIHLDAGRSFDPDGDTLAFHWWQYREAGTWRGDLQLGDAANSTLEFKAPESDDHKTLHVILEVTDDGRPALTGCRRVIIDLN